MAALRPVGRDERVRRPRALSVVQAAKSGTHRELLVALRDRLAKAIGAADCPPRDLAALTRRLQDIAKEIAAIDALNEGDEIGDAAATPDEQWGAT